MSSHQASEQFQGRAAARRGAVALPTRRTAVSGACVVLTATLLGCGPGRDEPQEGSSRRAAAVSACTTTPTLYSSKVWPSLDEGCVTCHTPGGPGAGSGLVLSPGGDMLANYNLLRDYALMAPGQLLSKTIGEPNHGGGKPFIDANSQRYKDLQTLIPEMTSQSCATKSGVSATAAFWKDVGMAGDSAVLAKASVLFAGRNPSAEESAAVASGGEAALRQTIRGYMQGPTFDRFLDDVGDTHFLSPGAIARGNGGLALADWPSAGAVLGAQGVTQVDNATRNRFDASVRREGVELMKFIVRNDRPYTDMVSGNYTVMNGLLARMLNATVDGAFVNPDDDTEWRSATLPEQRLGGTREHAGILSTQAWLSRFPTTDTNRNRHRVNMLYKQFLATDFSTLAVRPQDDGGATFRVPVMENPACTSCHDTLDPIAAGFQNWNEINRFLPNRTNTGVDHSLPRSYRSNAYPKTASNQAYYQLGDNWFRDGAAPGYAGTAMPGSFTGNRTALQWMGQQVAADPRFALGAVHFWYQGLFGREPLKAPRDASSPQYDGQLAAYNAQNEEFQAIATRFAAARYNVRDLLTDLMLSQWARALKATSAGAATTTRAAELHDVGSVTMLTPSQLNRKLTGVVGQGWVEFNNPYAGWALNYGDFDGVFRTSRAQSHTMMQTVTIDRLLAVRSCVFAKGDFDKAAGTRLLFPLVTLNDTPATPAGLAAVTANVRHLHKWLWKEDVPESDPEVQRTLKLFTDTWADRATAPARPVSCTFNNGNDPNYSGRAWATVLSYMLGDVKFLYE